MSNKFAKIFEVDGHQVLYRLDIDTKPVENTTVLVATTMINGLQMSTTYRGFEDENGAENAFDKANQEMADVLFAAYKCLALKADDFDVINPEIVK